MAFVSARLEAVGHSAMNKAIISRRQTNLALEPRLGARDFKLNYLLGSCAPARAPKSFAGPGIVLCKYNEQPLSRSLKDKQLLQSLATSLAVQLLLHAFP